MVRVGRSSGEEPHLLVGHKGLTGAGISPDGQWVFTSEGSDLWMWPMPDLTQAPLHTLPLDQLLAELRSLTNVRVVEDAESSSGWTLEVGPFVQ